MVQSLRTAQANIKRARDEVEEMLSHLDTARQVRLPPAAHRNTYPLKSSACVGGYTEGIARDAQSLSVSGRRSMADLIIQHSLDIPLRKVKGLLADLRGLADPGSTPSADTSGSLMRSPEWIQKVPVCIESICELEGQLYGTMYSGLTSMQIESTILAGPKSNLAGFLKSLSRLEASTAFLSQHR